MGREPVPNTVTSTVGVPSASFAVQKRRFSTTYSSSRTNTTPAEPDGFEGRLQG